MRNISSRGRAGGVDILEVWDNSVDIKWSVSCRYGGYDAGSFTIPLADFNGDWEKWLGEQISADKEKKGKIEKIREAANKERELRDLKRLADKYPKELGLPNSTEEK